jgi:hypothetical protein
MTEIQKLLDLEANLSNTGKKDSEEYRQAHIKIKELRGIEAPVCWGDDDCSTLILSQCPWRIDCYKE